MPQIPKIVVLFAAKRLSIMYKQPLKDTVKPDDRQLYLDFKSD